MNSDCIESIIDTIISIINSAVESVDTITHLLGSRDQNTWKHMQFGSNTQMST